MAARDMLTLDNPIAPRLIRILYALALILIALGMILGLVRGIQMATRIPPMPPLPMTGQMAPDAAQGQAAQTEPDGLALAPAQRDVRGPRGERGMFAGGRRFGVRGRFGGPSRTGIMGLTPRREPALFGALMIVRVLITGAIALLVVRILAEIALTVLALPKRNEA